MRQRSLKVTGRLVVGVVGLVRVRVCPEKSRRDQHAGVQSVCVVLNYGALRWGMLHAQWQRSCTHDPWPYTEGRHFFSAAMAVANAYKRQFIGL